MDHLSDHSAIIVSVRIFPDHLCKRKDAKHMFNDYLQILLRYMNIDAENIRPETRISDHCDLIGFAELLMEIEDTFGITIPSEISDQFPTVSQLWEYIENVSDQA